MAAVKSSLITSKHAKYNIRLLDRDQALLDYIILLCNACGTRWSCNSKVGTHLPPGYWKCPKGCNAKEQNKQLE